MTVDKNKENYPNYLCKCTRSFNWGPTTEKAVTFVPGSLKLVLQIPFVGRSKLLWDIVLFKLQGKDVVLRASSLVALLSVFFTKIPEKQRFRQRVVV